MSSPQPSLHPGMGAVVRDGVTTFRVWAPHADQVYVSGSFNGWATDTHPLAAEEDGYWSLDVSGPAPGDEYRYLIQNGEQHLWRIDPYARAVTSSIGNGIICRPAPDEGPATFQIAPWNELVLYELHVGTFNDRPGGGPGTFKTAISRLDYLQSLGVNAIQMMPPTEFAGGFSWGYNPAHIFAIEQEYGGVEGLQSFVQAAHRQQLAVLFDVVYNHLGPSDLDMWRFDGWSENELGGIYFYNDWQAQTPWGHTRPDYGRPEVRQYLRDNALMWLQEYGLDGLRWDATAWIRNTGGNDNDPAHDIPAGWSLMQWINDEIDAHQPHQVSIAEDLRDNPWLTYPTQAGGAGFDAQWDAAFVHPVRRTLIVSDDEARDVYALRDAITHRYGTDAFQRVIYTESHDEVANGKARLPEEIWHGNAGSWASKKRSTLGAVLVFTSPGIPMIFQGQEFLEDAWFHDQDPIDWSKRTRYAGILFMYRDLIALRRNQHGQTRGLIGQHVNVHHLNDRDKVIAFHRWHEGGPGDDVLVVINLANRSYDGYELGFPRPGWWRVRLNSDWQGYDHEFGDHPSYDTWAEHPGKDGLPCSGRIGIGPYSAIILSQDD